MLLAYTPCAKAQPQPNPATVLADFKKQQELESRIYSDQRLRQLGGMQQLPPKDAFERHEFILQTAQHKPVSKAELQMQECLQLMREEKADPGKLLASSSNSYQSAEFVSKTQLYTNALLQLKAMLEGRQRLSLRKAYWSLESAYGNTYLSYPEYSKIISESSAFIKTWMWQNNYPAKNNEALNAAIQKFMSDTLTTVVRPVDDAGTIKTRHLPFRYDYVDFKGEQDHRNYFVTKCLSTGYGQCNSLPVVYLLLAESIGAKAYLSIAPQHSFIKYPTDKGIFGYEPTSGYHISDQWYMDHLYITPEAVRNGVYLDTLSKKEIVANCVLDLAFGYLNKHGVADGKFIAECIQTTRTHAPSGKLELYVRLVESHLLSAQLVQVLKKHGAISAEQINSIPEAMSLYQALQKNEALISQLGYQPMPEQFYERIMQQHEDKAQTQKTQHISGKEKRNMFIQTKEK